MQTEDVGEDIDEHAEKVHAAIADSARPADDLYQADAEDGEKPGTPVYESHKKQLKTRKEPPSHGATAKTLAISCDSDNKGSSTPPPLSNRSQRGKYSFETFGVEPLGKNSWRLDSPRSLKVTLCFYSAASRQIAISLSRALSPRSLFDVSLRTDGAVARSQSCYMMGISVDEIRPRYGHNC